MIDNFPFKVEIIKTEEDYLLVKDVNDYQYIILILDKIKYSIYKDLLKYSSKIMCHIYDVKINDKVYLMFNFNDFMTEKVVKVNKILDVFIEIFENSCYEITLKKENLTNLNKLYRVLDHYFTNFEFIIREIELNPYKDDLAWIILSKYNILLDAKIFLYDLQNDLFKLIDNKEIIKYGLIFKNYNFNFYQKGNIMPFFDLYYAPLGMLFARYFLLFSLEIDEEKFYKKVMKLDKFNQKYFCFMCLYILVLNVRFSSVLSIDLVDCYLYMTKKIKRFMTLFKGLIYSEYKNMPPNR